jgi:hypothetical protein
VINGVATGLKIPLTDVVTSLLVKPEIPVLAKLVGNNATDIIDSVRSSYPEGRSFYNN